MAANPWSWELFYNFGASELGICVNAVLLEAFCFESFAQCLARPSGSSSQRADMVVSVHPLCQDLPLRILAHLDSNGQTRDFDARTTPFCTVVTDLGSAHPTWFHPRYVLFLFGAGIYFPRPRARSCADPHRLFLNTLGHHHFFFFFFYVSRKHTASTNALSHRMRWIRRLGNGA